MRHKGIWICDAGFLKIPASFLPSVFPCYNLKDAIDCRVPKLVIAGTNVTFCHRFATFTPLFDRGRTRKPRPVAGRFTCQLFKEQKTDD
jgi:hypothetical protein